jgi:hypothetical protein
LRTNRKVSAPPPLRPACPHSNIPGGKPLTDAQRLDNERAPVFPAFLLCYLAPSLCLGRLVRDGQREDFLAPEAALKRGDADAFSTLASGLADYPPYPSSPSASLRTRADRTSSTMTSK